MAAATDGAILTPRRRFAPPAAAGPPADVLHAHNPRAPASDPAAAGASPMAMAAQTLDMDHVHLSLLQFAWGMVFLGPNAVFHWVRGVGTMVVRQALAALWTRPEPAASASTGGAGDPTRLVADLLLESVTFPVYFRDMVQLGAAKCARFTWRPFHLLRADGGVERCEALDVVIDPVARQWRQARHVRAAPAEEALSAADTLVLVWFDLVFASHVKLHATANWAVNPQSPDAFVRRMGVVTVMYNYFGHTVFPKLGRFFFKVGLLPADGAAVKAVIAAGVTDGVHSHHQVGGVCGGRGFCGGRPEPKRGRQGC